MTPGKRKELEDIIREYQYRLFTLAFFRTGSVEDAKDIVQDVFVRMYKSGVLERAGEIRGYLYRSVLNRSTDYLRDRQRHRHVGLDRAAALHEEQCDRAAAEYIRIDTLLSALPPEQAEVLMMKCVNNLSFVEIADILQLPVTTVKSRFKYGIDKLRKKIN